MHDPDDLADKLAEELDLTEHQAEAVASLLRKTTKTREDIADALPRFLALLLGRGDIKARLIALAFAAGLDQTHHFRNLTEAANALGLSKAALSKMTITWRRVLNLPPNHYSVSLLRKHVDKVIADRKQHWRRKPEHLGSLPVKVEQQEHVIIVPIPNQPLQVKRSIDGGSSWHDATIDARGGAIRFVPIPPHKESIC